MSTSTDAEQLRARASALRRQAAQVRDASAFRLGQRSGDDVWIGPTADRFRADLADALSRLRSAADELEQSARTLDLRAAALEQLTRISGPQ